MSMSDLSMIRSTVYVVMGQGLEMSVSHVFPDGAHFSEQINSENLPYNIQNMDGKSPFPFCCMFIGFKLINFIIKAKLSVLST